ncbi:MAG TPA: hypothetical protein VK929_07290 [Longimicrobiales bacterium]|nr:hypothetical protein [Longimicrobiales bacterium]
MTRGTLNDADGGDPAAIYRAAIAYLQNEREGVVLVDPRPVRIRENVGPRETDFIDGSEDIVRLRTAVLHELGIETTAGLPLIPDCHGIMSAPPGQRVVHGCPERRTVVVLSDTVRIGAQPGQWVLRVLPTTYHPGAGREARAVDLIIARRDGVFTVIDWSALSWFERE